MGAHGGNRRDQRRLRGACRAARHESDDVNVEVSGNELRVTGEVKQDAEGKEAEGKETEGKETEGKPLRHRQGRFAYRTTLPADADTEHIDAQLADGILTVRVPKTAQSRSRQIEVKS